MRQRLLLVALIICFHWRLVFSTEFTWLEAPGVYEETLPLLQFQAGEIHKFRLPLWDPYTNGGRPLLTLHEPAPWYPPHLAFLALPFKAGWLRQAFLHWYFVLIHCAMALAMYSLARNGLGQSTPAAFLAACIYSLGGAAAASHQPHVMHAAALLPLVFRYAFTRDVTRAALCLGICWWPGNLEIPLFATIALAALAIVWKLRPIDAAKLFGLSLSIGAAAILPAWQLGGFHHVNYLLHEAASLRWIAWLGLVVPNFTPQPFDPYLGAVALFLGVLGFASVWEEKAEVRWLAVVAGTGIVLALGSYAMFHGILYGVLPGVSAAQSPAYASVLVHLALAAAAGWGSEVSYQLWRKRIAAVAGLAGAIALFVSAAAWTLRLPFVESASTPILSGFLCIALAILLWKGQPRNVATTALLLFLADLSQGVSPRWGSRLDAGRPRKLEAMANDSDVAGYLQRVRNDLPRAAIDPKAIPYQFGPWWGIETYPDTDPAYSVSLWVSREPKPGYSRMLFQGVSGVKVFGTDRDEDALPRPRIVYPGATNCPIRNDGAEFTRRLAGKMEIVADMLCDGTLLTGIRQAPGWTPTTRAANAGLQSIALPKGTHRLNLEFRPWGLSAGAGISAAGLLLAGLLVARRRPNKL